MKRNNKRVDERYRIIKLVASEFGIKPEQLQQKTRGKTLEVARPRQVAMFIMRMRGDYTLVQVGDVLGGRSPATVTAGFRIIADSLPDDNLLRRKIRIIENRLDKLILVG